jgi:hypothetical protein
MDTCLQAARYLVYEFAATIASDGGDTCKSSQAKYASDGGGVRHPERDAKLRGQGLPDGLPAGTVPPQRKNSESALRDDRDPADDGRDRIALAVAD